MEGEDRIKKVIGYFLDSETRMERLSRERLDRDYQSGRIPQHLYEKIITTGIPCSNCTYPVTPDTYGMIIETLSSKRELRVICRHSMDNE